jgi:hypothetical protein
LKFIHFKEAYPLAGLKGVQNLSFVSWHLSMVIWGGTKLKEW